jgi:hypothetical protein
MDQITDYQLVHAVTSVWDSGTKHRSWQRRASQFGVPWCQSG